MPKVYHICHCLVLWRFRKSKTSWLTHQKKSSPNISWKSSDHQLCSSLQSLSCLHCQPKSREIVRQGDGSYSKDKRSWVKSWHLDISLRLQILKDNIRNYQLIKKPVFPCVDNKRKIILQKNRVNFNYTSGDLIGFLMS